MVNNNKALIQKVFWWIGLILCVILIPILIMNVTLIAKSYMYPDKVPDFFGYKPLIVLSGSMEPTIMTGDIAIVKVTEYPGALKEKDIIAFRTGGAVVTHRIIEVRNTDKGTAYITKGDNNNGTDANEVLPEDVEGTYVTRIGGIGNFALFLQTPLGLLLFVVTPISLFFLYDFVSRMILAKKKYTREQELEAELERLKTERENSNVEVI